MDDPNYDESWAGPEPADETAAAKKFLWLGQSHSSASICGWRVFRHARQFEMNTQTDLDRITLFDDGTWKYGIWE
jgi:hypothetical protein